MPACAICGTPVPPPFRPPPPEGSPDLDGRPGEPTRSTLHRWLQTCPGCGASAPDLAALPPEARDILPGAASAFQRWAALVAGKPDEANAWLQAAWMEEDAGRDGTALRRRALAAWDLPNDAEGLVRLADVQRRAGLMVEAKATLDRLAPDAHDGALQVAAFERARIALGDTGRHLLSSALRPPARTPHVSHGKPTTTFWQRWLGGARR